MKKELPHGVTRWPLMIATLVAVALLASATTLAIAPQKEPAPEAAGPPPNVISYQGWVKDSGTPYTGTGYFMFSITDTDTGDGNPFWSTAEVSLPVSNGLFDVLLGDTLLPGMAALDASIFAETDTYLRIWFATTTGGPYDALSPNQRIASVPYALRATYAENSGPKVSFHAVNTGTPVQGGKIIFGSVTHQYGTGFNPSSSAFTAPTAGVYHFESAVSFTSNVSPACYTAVRHNGAYAAFAWAIPNTAHVIPLTITLNLAAGDQIDIYAYVACGTSVQATWTRFSGFQVFEVP